MTPIKQRIALRDLSTLSPEDQEMAEKNRIEGKIPNIFATLVNHPKLARSWLRFAGYILSRQTLPARDREIAILRIGWLNQAPYQWEQHVLIGRRAGLTDDEIERINRVRKRDGIVTTRRYCRRPTICTRIRWSRTQPGIRWRRTTAPSR